MYGAIETKSAAKDVYGRVFDASGGIQAKHAEAAAALAQARGAGEQQQLDMVNSVLQNTPPDSVELVIHIGCSLGELGIVVGDFGNIKEAPAGLFDKGYSVLAVDGKRFKPDMRDQEGEQDVILRCTDSQILASMSRVPSKFLEGLALKLLQVQVEPDKNGFGIDLTDSNIVASLVANGAAGRSELKKGDILVGVDGVNLGSKKLVQVMERGHSSYCFSVVRPAAPGHTDQLAPGEEAEGGEAEAETEAASPRADAGQDAQASSPAEYTAEYTMGGLPPGPAGDTLRDSLSRSLSQLQQQDRRLSEDADGGMIAPRILRLEPAKGTGVTVEWMPVPSEAAVRHYQLEWKLLSDSKWVHTEASSKLQTTLVTKGSLRVNGAYQFRVRACGLDGTGGPFTEPRPPNGVRPDGIEVPNQAQMQKSSRNNNSNNDALSMIEEEQSTVSGQRGPGGASSVSGGAMNIEMLQGVLSDQRQAMEEQYSVEQAKLEAAHKEQLRLKELEGEEWRSKFIDISGTRMQAVLDAKEEVRSEAEERLREDVEAASRAKLDALEAVRRAREAEDIAAACQAEVDRYKLKYETAHEDARSQLEGEARGSVELVMRKAAQEIKDKVRVAEIQADTRVERAIAETTKRCEAEAAAELRRVVHALEAKHAQQLQMVQAQAGAGLANRIAAVQEKQDAHVTQAVREAVAAEREAGQAATAAAAMAARAEGAAEAEARLGATAAKMERHVVAVTSQVDTKLASDLKLELDKAMAEAQAKHATEKAEAVAQAVARAEQRGQLRLEQMGEGVRKRIEDAVAQRERELIDEDGKVREASVAAELREQMSTYRAAASEAARQWGSGNDDFEEAALAKTSTALQLAQQGAEAAGRRHVMLEDDEFDGVASGGPKAAVDEEEEEGEEEEEVGGGGVDDDKERRKERRRQRKADKGAKQGGKADKEEGGRSKRGSSRKGAKQAAAASEVGGGDDGGADAEGADPVLPSGMAERSDVQRLRERHDLEMASLRSKHGAEEMAMMDEDATGTGEGRRVAAMQALRDRQMAEAIALGLAIQQSDAEGKARIEAEALAKAQQQERRKAEVEADAKADALTLGAALVAKEHEAPGYTALLGETRRAAGRVEGMRAAQQRGLTMADDDDLAGAVQSVRRLEAQLETMMRPQSELQQCLALEQREHRKTSAKLLQLGEHDRRSQQRQQRDHEGMEDGATPSQALQDALGLLQLYAKQADAMSDMLRDLPDGEMDSEVHTLRRQLEAAEATRQLGASKLEVLLRRGPQAEKDMDEHGTREVHALLEQAAEHSRACEQGVERLHAEEKRKRMGRLQEARRVLQELRRDTKGDAEDASLAIPVAPIAAAEDGFSIAIDWVPPVGGGATAYHLQWREEQEQEWASSAASERIGVPCCTKGSLRTHTAYQFRVRAFSDVSERWGPWSAPSEPTTPSILLESLPSRPELKPHKGLVIEAEWSPPVVGKKAKVAGYEVQWCLVGTCLEWNTEQMARTAKEFCTTAALRQGKCYTFRVRAMIKSYASSEWTAWSPPAAPCRTYRDLPPEHGGSTGHAPDASLALGGWGGDRRGGGDEAREPTESMIEGQLEQDAEDCPTEIRAAVRAEVRTLREQHAQDRQALGPPPQRDERKIDTLSTWD